MAKITVELEDNLQDNVEEAIDLVKDEFLQYLKDNRNLSDLPCLNNDLDDGNIHEIIDGCVPIGTYELKTAWFLHSNDLETALDNAGIYSNADLGNLSDEQKIQSAYYCYLQEAVNEWYSDEAQDLFDEWVESGQNDYNVGDLVFWNDPDNALTSRNATITEFKEGKVILDNGEIEALASELEEEHDP